MPESSLRDNVDRAIDFSLGLLSKNEESALLIEARKDAELEAMLRQQCAVRELARAESHHTRDRHHSGRVVDSRRSALPRRRLVVAASVFVTAIAMVLWMRPAADPELYWLPVDNVLSIQRSSGAKVDQIYAAIEAYAAHDLDTVINILEHYEAQGSARDMANLYLASALLNRNRSVDAARVLETIDLHSVPYPWRGFGQELQRRTQENIDR